MGQYVLSLNTLTPDPAVVEAAEQAVQAMGVTVLRKSPDSMLLDAPPQVMARLAKTMPDWQVNPNRATYRVPERTPLQRQRAKTKRPRLP